MAPSYEQQPHPPSSVMNQSLLLFFTIALTQCLHLPPYTPSITANVASTHSTVMAKYSLSNDIEPVVCMTISELNRLCSLFAFHHTGMNVLYSNERSGQE